MMEASLLNGLSKFLNDGLAFFADIFLIVSVSVFFLLWIRTREIYKLEPNVSITIKSHFQRHSNPLFIKYHYTHISKLPWDKRYMGTVGLSLDLEVNIFKVKGGKISNLHNPSCPEPQCRCKFSMQKRIKRQSDNIPSWTSKNLFETPATRYPPGGSYRGEGNHNANGRDYMGEATKSASQIILHPLCRSLYAVVFGWGSIAATIYYLLSRKCMRLKAKCVMKIRILKLWQVAYKRKEEQEEEKCGGSFAEDERATIDEEELLGCW